MKRALNLSLIMLSLVSIIAGCSRAEPAQITNRPEVAQPLPPVNLMLGYKPDAPIVNEDELTPTLLASFGNESVKVNKVKTFSNGETYDYTVVDGLVISGDMILATLEEMQDNFADYEAYLETGELPEDLASELSTQGAMSTSFCGRRVLFGCFERVGGGWPGGIVRYDYDSLINNFNKSQREEFSRAVVELNRFTNVRISGIGGTGRTKFDRIVLSNDSDGCYATLGRSSKQPQKLNLADNCFTNGRNLPNYNAPLHELGHALGLIHEHQRSDRDDFITVNRSNLLPKLRTGSAWNAVVPTRSSQGRTAYDVDSVMHYNSFVGSGVYNTNIPIFSVKSGVRSPLDGDFGSERLTALDVEAINRRY